MTTPPHLAPLSGVVRSTTRALALSAMLVLPWLALALPVSACSCAPMSRLADYAQDPHTSIFAGVVGPRDGRGVPVAVSRWFTGSGGGPVVWLADQSFGDGAGCGVPPPPPGSSWLFVAWVEAPGRDPVIGLCTPNVDLATADGQALLDEAVATFGGSAPTAAPTVAPPVDAGAGTGVDPVVATAVLVMLASVGIFGGVAAMARRRR